MNNPLTATSTVLDDLGRAPITQQSPAGEDARYEPEYALLLVEIEKLASITRGGSIAWPVVVDTASFILRNKAKDLQAACYLAVALAETQGLVGVPTGTRILTDFLQNFWETGFPGIKRLRGRVNAFDWWRERLATFLEAAGQGPNLSAELYQRIGDELSALDEALGEVMPDYMPLRDLKEAARHLPSEPEPCVAEPVGKAVLQAQEGADAAMQTSEPATSSVPPASPPVNPASPLAQTRIASAPLAVAPALADDAGKAKTQFLDFCLSYANFGRRANPSDPLAWRALRLAVWEKIAHLPPGEGNITMIPAPDLERKLFWQGQLVPGKDKEALLAVALAVEDILPTAVFWLDLQRIAATALTMSGEAFALAAETVRAETRGLLHRLPGLEEKTFADGTPFADPETKNWLASLQVSSAAFASSKGQGVNTLGGHALSSAENRFAAGDVGGALECLDEALQQTYAGGERLTLRLAEARLLCRAGEWMGATALAEALLEEVDRRDLSTWDEALVLRILLTAREAFEGLGETGAARAMDIRKRINRLAPSAGLRRN